MIISSNGIWLFFSFEYQNKILAPIFLLIGAAIVIIRAVSSMSKTKCDAKIATFFRTSKRKQ